MERGTGFTRDVKRHGERKRKSGEGGTERSGGMFGNSLGRQEMNVSENPERSCILKGT